MTSDIARKVVQTFRQPVPANGETENLSPREQEEGHHRPFFSDLERRALRSTSQASIGAQP